MSGAEAHASAAAAGPAGRPLSDAWELTVLPAGRATDPASLYTALYGVPDTPPATAPFAADPALALRAATVRASHPWLPAPVPGTAMGALFAAGEAAFERLPALDAQDVWYRCRFATPPATATARTSLAFDGLATLAQAWLNGEPLLESSTMFQAHQLDLAGRLRGDGADNELLLRFASVEHALKARRPRPRWKTRLVDQQQLRWLRTSLLGRIPGWTPAAPAIGPWRPVTLRVEEALAWDSCAASARLEDDGSTGTVTVEARLRLLDPAAMPRTATLRVGGTTALLHCEPQADGSLCLQGSATLPGVALWWPHTHGTPALHGVGIELDSAAGHFTRDLGRTGFRRITLDSAGDNFAIAVNGVPVFCRGACWTTTDILNLTGTEAATRAALQQARDAGMNMLRVGGTMFYEAPHFYTLCDELGILLWHDWMFANMDYPADDAAFVAGVEEEARQFLQRTRLAPSLALLCGNSEVEQQAAMLGLERDLWRNRLFGEVLPAIGNALRPDVPWWPSSPAGGVLPFQVDAGAAHYFGVGAYLQPLTDARRCGVRFTSECLAFANVPEPETIEALMGDGRVPPQHPLWKARVPRDGGTGWDFDDVRDHYVAELFQVDPARLRYADPERYLALGRAATGEVMAAAFAEWRRPGSSCAGALTWFLRDLWPGAGWGVVDAHGRPKAAWHYLRRALAPVALHMTNEGVNGLALHALNDGPRPIDVEVRLTLYRHGEQPVAQGSRALHLPAHGGLSVRGDALFGHFTDSSYSYRFGPPGHDLAHAELRDAATGALLGQDFFFPLGHGFPQQPALGLAARVHPLDGGYEVTVGSPRFAQAVHLDTPGFTASHNHFHLAPGGTQVLRLAPHTAGARLRGTLRALNSHETIKLAPPPADTDA